MKNTQLSYLVVDAQGDALAALLDGGYMDIYDGTQPATSDDAIVGQVLGVSLRFGVPAFQPCANGVLIANSIASGVIVNDINPATWARCYRADHTTVVMDVSVGTSSANAIVPTTNFVAGVTVTCGGFTHTIPRATPGN